jgi:RNA polymerase sigma-70 factor (ECF subfamily)
LVTVLRDEQDASEVFSQACEDMWRSIGKFEGRCTMRAWLYTLARHAVARFRRSPHRRPGRHLDLSAISDVAERVRSQTLPHLRTSVKDQFAAIRDSLDEDDRALLVLRVDRGMSWREIALTFSLDDDSDEALRKLEARLRKRLQFVKEEIRVRARDAGLLGR